MHAIPTEAPTTLFHRGPPLRTPDMAIFDRKDHAGGIVEPYKRLMRANIILEEMKSNIISRRDKNSTQRNNKHLNDLRSTHARFMGRLLGIAQTLNTVEKRDSDNEASSSSNSPSSSPSVDSAKTDDPSGLMSVLIELVGKMNTTDIPEDIIFDIVISALYRTFQDEISSIKAKDSELTSMSTSDNRYTRFLVQLMRAMPMNEKRVKLQEPRLTRLLLACPMVPNIVLREVMDHWCEEVSH
jgi:activator of HSP90 ATPase